jgi:hypothetical protein
LPWSRLHRAGFVTIHRTTWRRAIAGSAASCSRIDSLRRAIDHEHGAVAMPRILGLSSMLTPEMSPFS